MPVQPPDSEPGLMAVWSLVQAIFGDDVEKAATVMERAADICHWRSEMPPHIVPMRGRAGEERARRIAEETEVWWRMCAVKQRKHLVEEK